VRTAYFAGRVRYVHGVVVSQPDEQRAFNKVEEAALLALCDDMLANGQRSVRRA
jgi:hypothetical protein